MIIFLFAINEKKTLDNGHQSQIAKRKTDLISGSKYTLSNRFVRDHHDKISRDGKA